MVPILTGYKKEWDHFPLPGSQQPHFLSNTRQSHGDQFDWLYKEELHHFYCQIHIGFVSYQILDHVEVTFYTGYTKRSSTIIHEFVHICTICDQIINYLNVNILTGYEKGILPSFISRFRSAPLSIK